MTQLATAIQSLGLTGTSAEIRTAFGASGTPITDNTSYSLSGLAAALAIQGVDAMILVALRNHIRTLPVGGDTLEGFLIAGGGTSGGVDCSRADIRYQIVVNQSHPSTTAEQQAILAAMLLVGSTPRTKWEQAGLDALPEESDIAAAQTQIANQAAKTMFANEVLNAAIADESKSPDDIKQLVAEWQP